MPLESSELLLNTTEGTGLERTGYFVSQSDAVDYWEVSQSLSGLTGNAATASAKYDINIQMDSIHISGSNYRVNDHVRLNLNKTYSFTLEKDVNYDFSAEIYGVAKPKLVEQEIGAPVVKNIAEMEVFISGSNIPTQPGNEKLGAKLGVVRINDGSTQKDFGITTGDFESTAKSENCILTFKVNSGQFYVADISVRPATETGFSPDLFTLTAPMPQNEVRPETYEFLAEFYDVNNNQADAFTFTATGSIFKGSNMVITGEDNVLESNLFIGGESTASGMHLGGVSSTLPETGGAGAAGSGFMRSVGYEGFTSASNSALGGKFGFMMFSGSVLPDSGDDYKGVGLELVGASGSLKFRTNPSLFDVRADSFFVGRESIQFISGAEGNIEISSSEFHLTPEGNVTASEMLLGDKAGGNFLQFAGDTLTVQGDIAVDSIRTPAIIAGTTSTTANASSSIDAKGFASFKSASIAGFVVNPVAIHSADKSLVMSASGQITGSTVLFTGGKIASFTLSDDAFTAGNSFFISSSVTSPRSFFISSSKFNVKAGGDITGSDVLFDGGTIGGWAIGATTLTGGNLILDKAGDIKSADYQSDVKGWMISSQDNGFAEFENAKIRGTLSTTTFEKESVNAVGGQLFIANSTAITGSAVSASQVTMSVVNASGFAANEILQIKRATNTGFNTEYVKIISSSLDGNVANDELFGRIYVQRGLSAASSSLSASVGDVVGSAQPYEPGQVVVSTGKVGTGYIRLNANPNNQATPYMDIVERTGSNIYDIELKTRVGDLSGVAGTRNVPAGFTGFGIMSEVAFLSGSNIKLEAPAFILGDQNKTFVSGSEGNIEISSSAFHLKRDGQLLFGNKAGGKYVEWDNSNLVVRGDLAVDNIRTPSTILGNPSTFANASSSINSDGGAFFKSGSIAGFEFTDTSISKNSMLLQSTGNITLGTSNDVVRLSASDTTYRLWIGHATPGSAPFRVDKDGNFTATSATITGTINAQAGNFTGNITSGATITGGTIRTADETTGAGKSVKINGSTNTLEFFGDAAAFNSSATDIPTKLFFLDDSNQLIEGNVYSKFPGIGFEGFDVQASTYDNATDNGTSGAMNAGGLYVPYNYGNGYVQFESMYTGHALGLYRGARGETKLSGNASERRFTPASGNDYDYYYDTPDAYEVAQLKLIQTNGSPSARHNQDGNPLGFGGQSTFGDGGNHHIFTLQTTNVLSRSNIADNSRQTDGSGYKVARSISAGNNFRHGSTNGGGYNYFAHMELVGGAFHNTANDQLEQGFQSSKYYQWKFSTNGTHQISVSNENSDRYTSLATSYGSSTIDSANGGGSGHPSVNFTSETTQVTPSSYAATNWSTVEYIGYRIKCDDVTFANGNPSAVNIKLTLRVVWNSTGGQVVKDTILYNGACLSADGTYTGAIDCRGRANKWSSDKDHDIKVYLRTQQTGVGSVTLDFDNSGGAADTYVYAYGQGDLNTRVDNTDLLGTRISQYASGSGNVVYGVKNDSYYGSTNYGLYSRIRGAGATYGVYSRVNETGQIHKIQTAKNGQVAGANVYAGYFLGNLHVQGNITYSGTNAQSSDKRLKENIRIVSGSLNLIKQLETKRFDWKSDYEYSFGNSVEGVKNDIGFIAQDVEKIDGFSDLIKEDELAKRGYDPDKLNTHHPDYKDKTHHDFHKNFKFLNYEKLIPHLVNAMQEQQGQIDDLKKQIEELKQ